MRFKRTHLNGIGDSLIWGFVIFFWPYRSLNVDQIIVDQLFCSEHRWISESEEIENLRIPVITENNDQKENGDQNGELKESLPFL